MRILCVDDQKEILEYLDAGLTHKGHKVILANNGFEAVSKASSELPDLIFLDQMMPILSGIDCLRILLSLRDTYNIPVIMLTARNDRETVKTAIQLGVHGYCVKPLPLNQLEEKIASILSKPLSKKLPPPFRLTKFTESEVRLMVRGDMDFKLMRLIEELSKTLLKGPSAILYLDVSRLTSFDRDMMEPLRLWSETLAFEEKKVRFTGIKRGKISPFIERFLASLNDQKEPEEPLKKETKKSELEQFISEESSLRMVVANGKTILEVGGDLSDELIKDMAGRIHLLITGGKTDISVRFKKFVTELDPFFEDDLYEIFKEEKQKNPALAFTIISPSDSLRSDLKKAKLGYWTEITSGKT